jgi:hypothetical protein
MKTNKEKALAIVNNWSRVHKIRFNGGLQEAVELASNPDWYYPEKEEFPEVGLSVICILYNTSMGGSQYLETKISSYNDSKFNCEFDWVFVKAWTYLPKFEK